MPLIIVNLFPTEESVAGSLTVLLLSNCCVATSGYTLVPSEQLQVILATCTISPTLALLWVLYPMAALVGIELFLRATSNDDDDDDEGGGVMTPIYQGAQA